MDDNRIFLAVTPDEAFLLSLLLTEFRNEAAPDQDALARALAALCANVLPQLPQTTGGYQA